MANYNTLKAAIQDVIKTNGNNEITGALLQQSLLAMINSLGGYYQFAGIATPTTNPGTPDQNVAYIGSRGTYANFNSLVIPEGYIGVLKYNGSWSLDLLDLESVGKYINGFVKHQNDFEPALHGYFLKNGNYISSGNHRTWLIPNDHYNKLYASLFSNTVDIAAISFFSSSETFDETTLISNVRFYSMDSSVAQTFDETIPDGTKTIAVSNRSVSGDGTFTIQCLGVYSEIANLKQQIDDSVKYSTDVIFVQLNKRLTSAGIIHNNTNYLCTDFVPVKKGDVVVYSGYMSQGGGALCGYSDKNESSYIITFIQNVSNITGQEVVIPNGVNYVRSSGARIGSAVTAATVPASLLIKRRNLSELVVKQKEQTQFRTPFIGKNIAIIGDSISSGTLNPFWTVQPIDVGHQIQSYVTWYDVYTNAAGTNTTGKTIGGVTLTAAMIGTLQTFTPVSDDIGKGIGVGVSYYGGDDANIAWPYKLCNVLGANLINASWSGASMCSGLRSEDDVLSFAWSDYTIGRCRKIDANGNIVKPDIVIIYRGTNDFSKPQGEFSASMLDNYDIDTLGYPASDEYDNGHYSFERAYYLTIKKIREAYPDAIIYCATLNIFKRVNADAFPVHNSYYSLLQMNDAIRKIAGKMGCGLIQFDKSGITFENCYPTYINDSQTSPTHPNDIGQTVLANRALHDLSYNIRTTIYD